MLSKTKWTTIIGNGPVATATAKALRFFVNIEHIRVPVIDGCAELKSITYKKLIQDAQSIALIPEPVTKPGILISWINQLRGEYLFPGGILVLMQDKNHIERLKHTSLFREAGNIKYPLGADDDSQVLESIVPLSTLLTVNNDLAKVFVGIGTWTEKKAKGGSLCKAELLVKEIEMQTLDDKKAASQYTTLKNLLLEPETRKYIEFLINHNSNEIELVENSYNELEMCSPVSLEECGHILKYSKIILEVVRCKA